MKAANMFTYNLRHSYLLLILLSITHISYAEVYKWVDKDKMTHYSEQAPRGHDYEIINDPPPPAIDPAVAQKEADLFIEKVEGTYDVKENERQQAKKVKERQEQKKKYCETIKNNLIQYQNNPGRRMMDENGNIIAPNEEQRQQKIADLKKEIAENCK